jgi:hypothetical protein
MDGKIRRRIQGMLATPVQQVPAYDTFESVTSTTGRLGCG